MVRGLPQYRERDTWFIRSEQDIGPKEVEIKFDWIAVLLVVLLAASLYAFFTDVFPYPYGWIVLTVLLVFRLVGKERRT